MRRELEERLAEPGSEPDVEVHPSLSEQMKALGYAE
jgi:hypothetical protein